MVKAITNSGDWDCTYHYYYDAAWRLLEERNGSDQVIKQYVWGPSYIDELVQVGVNDDPGADDDGGTAGTQDNCDTFYYACQDANFNVLGLLDSTGLLKERYEYTPYGQRTVFISAGSSDPSCMAPVLESRRITVSGVAQPYGICDVGMCGYLGDKETGLDYVRNRYRNANGWITRDIIPYPDGMNLYQYCRSDPLNKLDSSGLQCLCGPDVTEFLTKLIKYAIKWRQAQGAASRNDGANWMQNNGMNLDWLSTTYKAQGCPSKECKGTYWLCGECVHDHWIGNFMFGFMGRLLLLPDWLMNKAGNAVQGPGPGDPANVNYSDPPWDTAGYGLGRSVYDELTNPNGKRDLCTILKSDINLWNTANNTAARPERTFLFGVVTGVETTPHWPTPHARGYHQCRKCPNPLPAALENAVPGGKFGNAFPKLKS